MSKIADSEREKVTYANKEDLPMARRQAPRVKPCAFCAEMKAEGRTFYPPHNPSPKCESGKHAHCTCDICF